MGSTGVSEVFADENTEEEEDNSSDTYTYDAEYVSERIANNYTKVSTGYTVPDKAIQWEEKYLMDSSYRHASPLAVELEAGEKERTPFLIRLAWTLSVK